MTQIQTVALKVLDGFFWLENLFSDIKGQRTAETDNTDSGLAYRGSDGGNRIRVQRFLFEVGILLLAVHRVREDPGPDGPLLGCP